MSFFKVMALLNVLLTGWLSYGLIKLKRKQESFEESVGQHRTLLVFYHQLMKNHGWQ